jgi:capsular polysaccharide biosynthesis protein
MSSIYQHKTEISEAKIVFRKKPMNYDSSDLLLFKEAFINNVSRVYIVKIKNLKIFGFYVFKNFSLLKEFCIPVQHRKNNEYKSYIKLLIYPKKKRIDQGMWVVDKWSKNYFHWLTECLPRIITTMKVYKDIPLILPEEFMSLGYVKESLEILKVSVVTYANNEKIVVKNCMLPSHLVPCGFNHEQIYSLKKIFNDFDRFDTAVPKNIYISRKLAKRRSINNELELIQLLKKFQFEIIEMELLSFAEQRKLMAETKILISNHGAGLTNMIFLNNNSKVIELFPRSGRLNTCFYHLASALNLDYYYLINDSDSENMQHSNITVDLIKLESLLLKILV